MPQIRSHISISERKIYLRLLDIAFVFLGLFIFHSLFDLNYFSFFKEQSVTWSLLLIFYIYFFGEIFEMYELKVASDFYLTLRSVFITVIFVTVFYVFTPILSPVLPENRMQIALFILPILLGILVNRVFYMQFIFAPRFVRNILLIADDETVKKVFSLDINKKSNKIIAYVSNKNDKSINIPFIQLNKLNLANYLKNNLVHEIIVNSSNLNENLQELNNQLISVFEKGIVVRSVDDFIEKEVKRITNNKLTNDFYNNFTFSTSHQNNLYLVTLRILDIVFGFIGIVFLIFLAPIVYIINFFSNKGNLFYFQKRVGKNAQEFTIIKFRTMVEKAEKNGAVWAAKNDNRITPFGRILRKTRLDEVPQFINVLKGDMSLIGPRPERKTFVKKLEKQFPFYAIRHVVKPGLTGWAQVMHPYASTLKDQQTKLMYDLYYIKERNLMLDFKIVIKTLSTIIFFRGN